MGEKHIEHLPKHNGIELHSVNNPSYRNYGELFIISFLVLFFELASIRWFGSYVVFLTFFTNIVLLASFLGMSVGCLAASRRSNLINMVPPLTLFATLTACGILLLYESNAQIAVDVGRQLFPERVYFGTEFRKLDAAAFVIPIELIASFFFVLIAIIFVGFGQEMGRCLDRIPHRVLAYTTNIVGSLAGIVSFAICSIFWLSPFWWFAVSLGGCCYFLTGRAVRRTILSVCAVVTVLLVGLFGWGVGSQDRILWSPYYRINYNPTSKIINVNNIGHQKMVDLRKGGIAYLLPYLLNQATQRPPFKTALIIGAGAGNDASAALRSGVERIDSVEIDPVIYQLGRRDHPGQPYKDRRVKMYLNDGRNFLKDVDQKYDLIVYALVDSLVLHSGYSSIRLENFLFTREAFADVKARLKKDGLFVVYNYFRHGWIVSRLVRTVQEVFGREPLVFALPYSAQITPSTRGDFFTMIFVGDTDPITDAFKTHTYFWYPRFTSYLYDLGAGFGVQPLLKNPKDQTFLEKIGPAKVFELGATELLPSDSWPFLYLKDRKIPSLSIRGMAAIGILSLIILVLFAPRGALGLRRFNWTMFFLGAGFMLLETKGVVHMALLFGSTWIVNSIVFFAILVMILLSNLFVLRFHPTRLTGYYTALVFSLALNVVLDLEVFLGLPGAIQIVGSCMMVFIPIFFAGVIFATIFRESRHADRDFGANVAGVVLGGIAENFSMVLGFKHLLWLAIVFYLLAKFFQRRLVLGTM